MHQLIHAKLLGHATSRRTSTQRRRSEHKRDSTHLTELIVASEYQGGLFSQRNRSLDEALPIPVLVCGRLELERQVGTAGRRLRRPVTEDKVLRHKKLSLKSEAELRHKTPTPKPPLELVQPSAESGTQSPAATRRSPRLSCCMLLLNEQKEAVNIDGRKPTTMLKSTRRQMENSPPYSCMGKHNVLSKQRLQQQANLRHYIRQTEHPSPYLQAQHWKPGTAGKNGTMRDWSAAKSDSLLNVTVGDWTQSHFALPFGVEVRVQERNETPERPKRCAMQRRTVYPRSAQWITPQVGWHSCRERESKMLARLRKKAQELAQNKVQRIGWEQKRRRMAQGDKVPKRNWVIAPKSKEERDSNTNECKSDIDIASVFKSKLQNEMLDLVSFQPLNVRLPVKKVYINRKPLLLPVVTPL